MLADVGAAFLLVAAGACPPERMIVILLAGVCLYWAGMVLNDVFDVEKDKAERSNRPLASGAIAVSTASKVGWALLIVGVGLAAVSGYLPSDVAPQTWLPGAVGLALAGLIVAYDGPLKPTPFAPAAMGGCRVLSFLLGASPMLAVVDGVPVIPQYLLGFAMAFGVYVMGITTFARDEATGGHRVNLRTGCFVMIAGAMMIGLAPSLADLEQQSVWAIRAGQPFGFLIGLVVMPVVIRAVRVQFNPEPKQIGHTIRAAILTIIPLAAAVATLGAGPKWGLSVFALIVPAIGFALKLRVT